MEKERCSGEEAGERRGLVWRRHSSSSLFWLRRFFSVLSFSTDSWRLALSSDSCLQIKTAHRTTVYCVIDQLKTPLYFPGIPKLTVAKTTNYVLPGQGQVPFNTSLQVFILLLQNLDLFLEEHILLSLLKKQNTTTAQSFIHRTHSPSCASKPLCGCVSVFGFFEPTTFSRSVIFFSCWCICWFFISTTSFKLFRSCSMCL